MALAAAIAPSAIAQNTPFDCTCREIASQ